MQVCFRLENNMPLMRNRLCGIAAIALIVAANILIAESTKESGEFCETSKCPNKKGAQSDSCTGRCDASYDDSLPCQCNSECEEFVDCCVDYESVCGGGSASCAGRCDASFDSSQPCQCNDECAEYDDCCDDYDTECSGSLGSCAGRCNGDYDPTQSCQCNDQCEDFTDCCPDYDTECGGTSAITDQELKDMGQKIWDADTDRLDVSLNPQGVIKDADTTDDARDPLFNSIPAGVTTNPLYQKLTALYDDYNRDQTVQEKFTTAQWAEIDDFLTEAMKSGTLQATHDFLASKGIVSADATEFQATLKGIWYTMYERDNTQNSSSGAEHVQVGEVDGSEISGLHDWVRFAQLEQAGSINYLGYVRLLDLGGAYIIRNPFYWDQYYKPIGGFFIGTSPAFDMSVFTLCFYARPNALCNLQVNSLEVQIQTYTINCSLGDAGCVGSSYPNY